MALLDPIALGFYEGIKHGGLIACLVGLLIGGGIGVFCLLGLLTILRKMIDLLYKFSPENKQGTVTRVLCICLYLYGGLGTIFIGSWLAGYLTRIILHGL